MKNSIFKMVYALAFFLPLFIISCEEEQETAEITLSRMFRPASLIASIDSNRVGLTWTDMANSRYIIQLSQDSLLFTKDLKEFERDSAYLVVDKLLRVTQYSARIKSVSLDGTSADSGWKEISFITE